MQRTGIAALVANDRADPALVVPDGPCLSHRELSGLVAGFADVLAGLGIRRGDRIAIALPPGPEAVVATLGALLAGAAAPLNPTLTTEEFRFALGDVSAKALVVPPEAAESARQAMPEGAALVEMRIDAEGGIRLALGSEMRLGATAEEPCAEDVALVLHSSGTTGRPKRVALAHRHLAASVEQIVRAYTLSPADVGLAIMPLFHVHGLVAGVLAALRAGGAVVLPRRFNPARFARVVSDHRVTWYTAVPTLHQLVLERGAREDGASNGTLRFLRSASAKLPRPTLDALEARFGVPAIEAYGMTEAAHQIATNPLPPGRRVAGTVGCGTGVEIRIAGEHGEPRPHGGEGEVLIRGPNVIQRYDDMPEVDRAAFRDGWFRTGDVGVLDAEGRLTLVGRIREMVNRGGEKISPLEVEEALLSHGAVAEAVCFGVPDIRLGEEVAAAVVLRAPAGKLAILRHCRERLAAFKVPKRLYVVEEIPRSRVGKVQRSEMRSLLGIAP